jgi:hypothetical protein
MHLVLKIWVRTNNKKLSVSIFRFLKLFVKNLASFGQPNAGEQVIRNLNGLGCSLIII